MLQIFVAKPSPLGSSHFLLSRLKCIENWREGISKTDVFHAPVLSHDSVHTRPRASTSGVGEGLVHKRLADSTQNITGTPKHATRLKIVVQLNALAEVETSTEYFAVQGATLHKPD